jgi:hypothetical protein
MMIGLIASLFGFAAMVCGIIILVDAFQSAWWRGLLCFLTCGLYMIYYAFAHYRTEHKWVVVGLWLFGGSIAGALRAVAQGALG